MWKHIFKIYILFFKGGLSWQYLKKYKKLSLKNLVSEVTLESTFEDLEADLIGFVPSYSEIDAFDIQIETEEGFTVMTLSLTKKNKIPIDESIERYSL